MRLSRLGGYFDGKVRVEFVISGSVMQEPLASSMLTSQQMTVEETTTIVNTIDNITIDKTNWITGGVSKTVEWEGRNWKTKSKDFYVNVDYITEGTTKKVKRISYAGDSWGLAENEYLMQVKRQTSYDLAQGELYLFKFLWWKRNKLVKQTTEYGTIVNREITTTTSVKRDSRWIATRGSSPKVIHHSSSSQQTTYNQNVQDWTQQLSEEGILVGAIQAIDSQIASWQEAEQKAAAKASGANLSGWQKFVNTVGGAFDAYHAATGDYAGISIVVNTGVYNSALSISGGGGGVGSNDDNGLHDAILNVIESAPESDENKSSLSATMVSHDADYHISKVTGLLTIQSTRTRNGVGKRSWYQQTTHAKTLDEALNYIYEQIGDNNFTYMYVE